MKRASKFHLNSDKVQNYTLELKRYYNNHELSFSSLPYRKSTIYFIVFRGLDVRYHVSVNITAKNGTTWNVVGFPSFLPLCRHFSFNYFLFC